MTLHEAALLRRQLPALVTARLIGQRISFATALMALLNFAPQAIEANPLSCANPEFGRGEKQQIDAWLKLAIICVQQKQPAKAVAILTQVIKADPLNAAAF
jgi:predicted negative regulator of RcsB-dependent stress response